MNCFARTFAFEYPPNLNDIVTLDHDCTRARDTAFLNALELSTLILNKVVGLFISLSQVLSEGLQILRYISRYRGSFTLRASTL